jgi:hypothetical protein
MCLVFDHRSKRVHFPYHCFDALLLDAVTPSRS